jgi:hypothetical protein
MISRKTVGRLSAFVKMLAAEKFANAHDYSAWAKSKEEEIANLFGYERQPGMPPITSLFKPFMHPTLPLIGLNYTQQAHNTLYEFTDGWTPVLRLCRGIIFDRKGNLVALPFPKFFNYGEHEETRKLPRLGFDATEKFDGHLGIIFKYQDQLLVTTRGDFNSRTSVLAGHMLKRYAKQNNWLRLYPNHLTLLVEIIHPDTKVYLDYSGEQHFTVIGAFDTATLTDYAYDDLRGFAEKLQLPITRRWVGDSLKKLIALMEDRSIDNKEGFVVCFTNGLRVKLKYQTYIGKMVADKLSHAYLMQRMIKGNLEKMLDTLPEEIYGAALGMLGEIMLLVHTPGTPQERWRRLYDLVPDGQSTPYFQSICRSFVKNTFGK